MNTKLKLVRFVLAVTFGSLLWAGCASPENRQANHYNHHTVYTTTENRAIDLTKERADTYPARRSGLLDRSRMLVEIPGDSTTINEAAGAERLY